MNREDEIEKGSNEDLAIEVLARFTGNSRGTPIAKREFIAGANWMRERLAGYSSSQASNVPKKCKSKEHGMTGFYKNMQVSYCMDCEKVWQDDESASSQATPKPVEGDGWINVEQYLPGKEDYYEVRFDDGTTDEKPFRIRYSKNILGFMTEKKVTHWRPLPTPHHNQKSKWERFAG